MKIKITHGIMFLMLFLIISSVSLQSNMIDSTETTQEDLQERLFNLKTAGFWNNYTFIHITNLNWTVASSKEWCTGSGTWGDPYIIENMIINASDSPIRCGILIENSVNVYFKIQNVTITDSINGIKFENTNKGTLLNNILSNNKENGIFMDNSANNTISRNQLINNGMYGLNFSSNCQNNKILGNTVKDNGVNFGDGGIYLSNFCNDNEIRENLVYDNYAYGINIEYSCERNLVINNTLENVVGNQQSYGIRLYSGSHQNTVSLNLMENLNNFGIYLVTSDQAIISNNKIIDVSIGMWMLIAHESEITSNTISGGSTAISMSACDRGKINSNFINNTGNNGIIIILNSDDNEFHDNIIKDNNNYGVYIEDPSDTNNNFYKNSFISNGIHVFDNGTANFWNNTVIGNYWDNYSGMDLNYDSIGDTPYNLPGAANANDSLPIVDHGPPSITINTPTSSRYNATAPEFNIFVNETYIFSMWYRINDTGMKYHFSENGTINQNAWSALKNGSLTISFYVRDIAWNIGFATVDPNN
jgi:parallel beta-helix repeat protein